jgi:hypothetical protein
VGGGIYLKISKMAEGDNTLSLAFNLGHSFMPEITRIREIGASSMYR